MKKLLILFSMLIVCITAFSQNVGIGTTSPSSSALLELRSTTKGLLIPRLNTAQKQSIAAPAAGLLVYDTTLRLLSYWTGSVWQNAAASANYWTPSGNNISSNNTGNVGIGVAPTRAKLEVYGSPTADYTAAMFGSGGVGIGITLENNRPAIGFNQYNNAGSKYMADGYAMLQYYDVALGKLIFYTFAQGTANTTTSGINSILSLASNGYVGIGYVDPTSPLSFANTLGNKISFWNNGPGSDYGIGLQAERLLIYTGNKIEMGSGNGNSFSNAFTFDASNGNMFSKQTGNLNLVPLGAVSFRVTADNGCSIYEPGTNFTNHTGSIVLSQTAGVPVCNIALMYVESDLYLNPATTGQYSKVIAVGAPVCEDAGITNQKKLYGKMQGNSQYHIEGEWDESGLKVMTGTVLFYGIK